MFLAGGAQQLNAGVQGSGTGLLQPHRLKKLRCQLIAANRQFTLPGGSRSLSGNHQQAGCPLQALVLAVGLNQLIYELLARRVTGRQRKAGGKILSL